MPLDPSLALMNESALHSLEEGLEETLTLHRLGLMPAVEAVLSDRLTALSPSTQWWHKSPEMMKRWTNANQRSRWLATAFLRYSTPPAKGQRLPIPAHAQARTCEGFEDQYKQARPF